MFKKYIILLLNFFILNNYLFSAPNSRSDTIDILKYVINLNITDFQNKRIKGYCKIIFKSKQNNVNKLNLDLLNLNVDSVLSSNQNKLTFSYNDTLLSIFLPIPLNVNDTDSITVYYGGTPVIDASGWGGFYFSGNYAFNLGVGFDAIPHNYGRVWFPCFDNFVEHSKYEFYIKTSGYKPAYCNGYRISLDTINADTLLSHWIMNNEIPSYLACVAIGPYISYKWKHIGINDTIPVEIAVAASDTTKLKNSFVNLDNAIECFENRYGVYRWNKVGYSLIPFSSGAMEHATNISYPKILVDGSLNYETTMAHELSHHWWGDLVTTERAEEMWINEGMAVYSEHLFLEWVYGYNSYLSAVRNNHANVLQYAHIIDGGYYALNNINQNITYGYHSYYKGASVAHNLRTYLGDSLFFYSVKQVMDSMQFKNINSMQLRDLLSYFSAYNLNNFFNDWVFNPGYPDFVIDSSNIINTANTFNINLYVKQKLDNAPYFFKNLPMEFTFYDSLWKDTTILKYLSGEYDTLFFTLPFYPKLIVLNMDNKINIARTDLQKTIKSTGNYNFAIAKMNVNINSLSDSILLRIEHHWVAPDPIKNNTNNYKISLRRYWKVSALTNGIFKANAKVYYDARNITSGGAGWLDNDLVSNTEDSLILLYRKNSADDWKEFKYYTKNTMGSSNNRFGYISIDSLIVGEYAFANGITTLSLKNRNKKKEIIELFPNPVKNILNIRLPKNFNKEKTVYKIYNLYGKLLMENRLNDKINISTLSNATYLIVFEDKSNLISASAYFVKE